MIIKYLTYWTSMRRVQSEKATLTRLDTVNTTDFKEKFLKGEIDLEGVAEGNHEKGYLYDFVMYETSDDDYPSVYASIYRQNKHIGVSFIDPAGREYLSYSFSLSKKLDDKFFLREIWFREYSGEDSDHMRARTHYVFDEEGNVSTRVYDMLRKKTLDYEGKEPIDPSGLYEDYPEFGQYEGITKLERDIPFDIVE